MRMCLFRAQYSPICPEIFFLVQTIIITFIYLLALFLGQNFKQILQQSQSYEHASFLDPKWFICPIQMFLKKIININFFYLLAPFVMRMNLLWTQNSPFAQMRIFLKKPVNKLCFFYSSLSTCQKSKLDIHILMIYWQLKNTEIPLAKNIFWV